MNNKRPVTAKQLHTLVDKMKRINLKLEEATKKFTDAAKDARQNVININLPNAANNHLNNVAKQLDNTENATQMNVVATQFPKLATYDQMEDIKNRLDALLESRGKNSLWNQFCSFVKSKFCTPKEQVQAPAKLQEQQIPLQKVSEEKSQESLETSLNDKIQK